MTTAPRLLCIDTSEYTSIALVEGDKTLASATHESARHHAENISVLIGEVLAAADSPTVVSEAGLDAVVVGTGPAPFTGLRAGLISAQVTAHVCGIPVYGVSALDVIARQALDLLPPETEVVAVSDARRKEIYWARYRACGPDDVERVSGPDVGYAADMVAALGHDGSEAKVVAAGTFPAHSLEALNAMPSGPCAAFDVAVAARIVQARLARREADEATLVDLGTEPLYLRRPEIHGQPMERM